MKRNNFMLSEHMNRIKTRCLECLAPIYLKPDVTVWTPLNCPECHTLLEVISLAPPELGYIIEEDDEGLVDFVDTDQQDTDQPS